MYVLKKSHLPQTLPKLSPILSTRVPKLDRLVPARAHWSHWSFLLACSIVDLPVHVQYRRGVRARSGAERRGGNERGSLAKEAREQVAGWTNTDTHG